MREWYLAKVNPPQYRRCFIFCTPNKGSLNMSGHGTKPTDNAENEKKQFSELLG